jgi:hypothetical protein
VKPCPNPECNSLALEFLPVSYDGDNDNGSMVSCNLCGMQGPFALGENTELFTDSPELTEVQTEAARLWNLLPRNSDVADAWESGVQYALTDGARHWTGSLDQASIVNPHRQPVIP